MIRVELYGRWVGDDAKDNCQLLGALVSRDPASMSENIAVPANKIVSLICISYISSEGRQ